MKKYQKQLSLYAATLIVICLCVYGLYWVVTTSIRQNKEWKEYIAAHCKVVAQTKGRSEYGYQYGMQANGKMGYGYMTRYISGSTTWECDNGVKYTR